MEVIQSSRLKSKTTANMIFKGHNENQFKNKSIDSSLLKSVCIKFTTVEKSNSSPS